MISSYNINNLSGGISEQQDELRFSNQVEDMENMMITTTGELRRRNGLEYVNDLPFVVDSSNTAIHSFDRGDGLEKYGMILWSNAFSIFDSNGNKMKILDTDGNDITNSTNNYPPIRDYALKNLIVQPTAFYSYEFNGYNWYIRLFSNDGQPITFVSGETVVKFIVPDSHPDYEEYQSSYEGKLFYTNINFTFPNNYIINTGELSFIQSVVESEVTEYLKATEYLKKNVEFLTVGDTTWLLNKKVVVTSENLDTVHSGKNAFYWISKSTEIRYNINGQSARGYDYTVNGKTVNSTSSESAILSLKNSLSSVVVLQYSSIGNYTYDTSSAYSTYSRVISATVNVSFVYYSYSEESGGFISGYRGEVALQVSSNGSTWSTLTTRSYDNSYTSYSLSFSDVNIGTNRYFRFVAIEGSLNYDVLSGVYANVEGTFSTRNVGSILKLSRVDGTNISNFTWSDSFGNQASNGWTNSVAKLSDLPPSMNGFTEEEVGIVAITGTDKDSFTNYYIKWNGESWVETVGENLRTRIHYTTMPIKIFRNSDGDFVVGYNKDYGIDGFRDDWEDRRKGDDDSNPVPSFVGSTISNMFFFRNRLCFTSGESVCMSEVGEYYNFFATTVMEVLDGDPIDVTIDSNQVSNIRFVSLTGNAVTLWSDNAQYMLSGGDVLSPATTRISATSSYNCSNSIKPINVDNEVLFFNEAGDNITVMSYSPSSLQSDTSSAMSINSHVPNLINKNIIDVAVSQANNLVFILSENNTIYVYKYFIQNNEKVISAWSKWTFEDKNNIVSINILDNELFVLANVSGHSFTKIFKINISNVYGSDEEITDLSVDNYTSYVTLTKFSGLTRQKSKNFIDKFFVKNFEVNSTGKVYLDIINLEREGSVKTIHYRNINRKQYIGGDADKIRLKLWCNDSNGSSIGIMNISGIVNYKSQNIEG